MNEIASKANLVLAFKAVKRNKGAPGVDNMTVTEVAESLDIILEELSLALINQTYRPCPVLGVRIPKTNGDLRQLGIPIVIDRIVQQAIAQILTKIYDPTFSKSSFGFRPD
jgi:RNA-directed DNA polymerase